MAHYGTRMTPGQHPLAEQVIVHLSDLHLTADAAPLFGVVDADAQLGDAIGRLTASGVVPAAIVVTGDVADDGAQASYARARALLEPVAQQFGAALIWVMGNHDRADAFRSELLGGVDAPAAGTELVAVHDLAGLRLVVLDTSVAGLHHGALSDDQLDWLAATLAEPAPRGTVIAMHHPPLPVVIAPSDTIELHGQQRLAAVLAGRDVRGIIAGHLHYATSSIFAGVPVWVAAACCYSTDPLAPDGWVRGQGGGQAISLLHVYPDRLVHTSTPTTALPTLYGFPPRQEG